MAQKSGGTIPPKQPIADANQAVALLGSLHHWQCTKVNSKGRSPRYRVVVTHAGKRAIGYRQTFVDAAITALAKLRGGDEVPIPAPGPYMRLVQ